jgi:Ni,Fe-hydrogenase I large subunit
MNSIAVFGDSFAANPHLETYPTTLGFIKIIYNLCNRKYNKSEVNFLKQKWGEKYKAWPRHLDATVFAQSGSDLYYSYNQFINNHKQYEKCIFVVTSPLRYSTNIKSWIHTASIEDATEAQNFVTDKNIKKYYKVLADFFENIYYKDIERIELLNLAMLDSIRQKRPDTMFINSFPDLKTVYDLELKSWNSNHEESQDYTKYFDLRQCHMTNDNNKILADYIKENLEVSGYLDISKINWKRPTLEEKDQYLVKTENLFDFLKNI